MKLRRYYLLAALTVLLPASAQAMSVADFLGRADALKAKGMAAMFSPDIKLLKGEITTASTAYRADPASKPPRSCPPPKGTARVSSDDLIAAFRLVPPPQRASTSVRAAFAGYMMKRFPCT